MDRGAWGATVHGVAKGRTQLSDFPFTFHFQYSFPSPSRALRTVAHSCALEPPPLLYRAGDLKQGFSFSITSLEQRLSYHPGNPRNL